MAQSPRQIPGCARFGECELITCNPDGTYTYTLAVTNLSSFAATSVKFNPITPSGVTFTPNAYPLSPPLNPQATQQLTVKIAGGVPGGPPVCFPLMLAGKNDLHCSTSQKCITLPACGPVQPRCASGACCGIAPHITKDPKFAPFTGKRLAVTTSRATYPTNTNYPAIQSEAVVRVVDLSESGFVLNTNVAAPMYYGPPGNQWTHLRLGTVFGIALDPNGNIFVTATSAYNGDSYPAPGTFPSGTIWRLDGLTGIPSVYAQLPNFQDPTLVSQGLASEAWPALGDIAYDCKFGQFFVTNLEDGKIYRLKSGTPNNLTGTTLSNFDPFGADPGNPGFAPLGERLVAVKVHNGRVYYSVWKEDCGNQSATDGNEIWSVGLNPSTGDFVPTDNRRELQIPPLQGQSFSNPAFDISFSPDGKMLFGERTMRCDPVSSDPTPSVAKCTNNQFSPYAAATLAAAHASRALEYACNPEGATPWSLSPPFSNLPYKFNIGNYLNSGVQCPAPSSMPENASGGVDYDFSNSGQYTVWTTGDSLLMPTVPIPYGLQGFAPGGGGMVLGGGPTTAVAIDLNGILGVGVYTDKAQIGDVELACPLPNTH